MGKANGLLVPIPVDWCVVTLSYFVAGDEDFSTKGEFRRLDCHGDGCRFGAEKFGKQSVVRNSKVNLAVYNLRFAVVTSNMATVRRYNPQIVLTGIQKVR